MKKRILLGLALLASIVMNAQVLFEQNFAEAPAAENDGSVGWWEYVNTREGDTRELTTLDGKTCVHFYNSDNEAGASWMRAVKFRNLPIKENTMYRVSFKLQGSNTYLDSELNEQKCNARADLMQGGENCDIAFVNKEGAEQHFDVSHFQMPSEGKGWMEYTQEFFYTTKDAQAAAYTKGELPETYFLTINCYNPGDFYITDVKVEEVGVEPKLKFKDDVISVNFGQPYNAADICGAVDRKVISAGYVTVKGDGEVLPTRTVEVWKDGNFYIFLDDEAPAFEEGFDDVTVSFNNIDELIQYAAGSFVEGTVPSFEDLEAVYDKDMETPTSYVYITPTLVSADPDDGSFNLPNDIKTFTLTFDKLVDCSKIKGYIDSTPLTVVTEGKSAVVEFANSTNIETGIHQVKFDRIYPEEILQPSIYGTLEFKMSFGYVEPDPTDVERTVMTDEFDKVLSTGKFSSTYWVNYNEGVEQDGTSSGCRVMGGFSGDFTHGFYSGARGSYGWATYGEREGEDFILTPGKYVYSMNVGCWQGDAGNRGVNVQIVNKATEEVVAENFLNLTYVVPGAGKVEGTQKFELQFNIADEAAYVIKVLPRNADNTGDIAGWTAIVYGNVKIDYVPKAMGALETKAVNDALAAAKKCLEDNDKERYAGTALDALKASVEKYDGKPQTSPTKCQTAVDELNAAVKDVQAHVSLCDTYDGLLAPAIAARDLRTGSKYESMQIYADLCAAIEKYSEEGMDPETLEPTRVAKVLTDDAELTEAIAVLKKNTAACDNIGKVNNLYLASMRAGLNTLTKLNKEDSALTNEVEALLVDDRAVAEKVQNAVTTAIYATIVADPTYFDKKVDPDTQAETCDSINVTTYIANHEMYHTAWDDKRPEGTPVARPSSENVPGWTINKAEGGYDINFHYPWGGATSPAYDPETAPAAPGCIAAWGWQYEISQELTNLPVGNYTLSFGAGIRDGEPNSYVFVETSEIVMNDQTLEEGPWRYEEHDVPTGFGGKEPTGEEVVIPNIVVKDGYLKFGANMNNPSFVWKAFLYYTGPAEGVDYNELYTVVDQAKAEVAKKILVNKFVKNGKLVISKGDVKYNAAGAIIK